MATFINTRAWRKEELRRAIVKVLENTDKDNAKTASAIAEELRDILPYVVAVQSVTSNIFYTEPYLSNARVRRNSKGWFYLEPKVCK
jgi:hypothetical protein